MAAVINIETDDIRPAQQVIKSRTGKRVSPATLWRWRLKGVGGVKLPMVRVGGVWHTTVEAFAEFVRAQTAALTPADPVGEVSAERSESTRRRLEAAGLV